MEQLTKVPLYVTTGHGEIDLADTHDSTGYHKFQEFLTKHGGIEIKPISSPIRRDKFEDHSVLLIAAPKQGFSSDELRIIYQYALRNNGLLILGSGRNSGEKQVLNPLTSKLCGVMLESNTVSVTNKWSGKNPRSQHNYKIIVNKSRREFFDILDKESFEVIFDESPFIVRLRTGQDYRFDPVKKLKEWFGKEAKILVLPPVPSAPQVVEVVPLANHEILQSPEEVAEIEYAFGCSLNCDAAGDRTEILLASPASADPVGEPLAISASVGQGKVAIIGSSEMFSNNVGYGLFSLSNSILIRNLLEWLIQPASRDRGLPHSEDNSKHQKNLERLLQDLREMLISIAYDTLAIAGIQDEIKKSQQEGRTAERSQAKPTSIYQFPSNMESEKRSELDWLEKKRKEKLLFCIDTILKASLESESE